MKPTEEFQIFYTNSLLPVFEELEVDRKQLVRKMRPLQSLLVLFSILSLGGIIASSLFPDQDLM